MIKMTASDLVYINEAAKALKQGEFIFINDKLIGLDNIHNYLVYVKLELEYLSNIFNTGIIINARELSRFVKSITTESEFLIDDTNIKSIISTSTENLIINNSTVIMANVLNRFRDANRYDNMMMCNDIDITNRLEPLFSMKKANGVFKYIYDSSHYITLFPGLLPLTRTDTVHFNLFDIHDGTFVTRFIINKKKFKVFVYVRYLQI